MAAGSGGGVHQPAVGRVGVAAQVEAGRLSAAAAWLSHWVALPGFASFAFLVVVFPTGRLPSQRWRWVVWSLTLGVVLLSVAVAFAPGMVGGVGVGNPYAWDAGAGLLRTLDRAAGLLLTAGAAGAVASLVMRFRRSRGDERQQLKWFLLAIVVLVVALAFAAVASGPLNELSFVLAVIALTGVPVAVGVAILEYHLYDIDQVINRALVYGALTVVVAGLYVASVGLITVSFDRSLGLAASLMATVVVAVAFQPLRARLQRVADQLVYGQRNEPAAALSTLARQLHAAPDPRAVPEQIVVTVASALKLPYVAIELDRDDGARLVAERGDRPRGRAHPHRMAKRAARRTDRRRRHAPAYGRPRTSPRRRSSGGAGAGRDPADACARAIAAAAGRRPRGGTSTPAR